MYRKVLSHWRVVVALLVIVGGVSLAIVWGTEQPAQAAAGDPVSPSSLQLVASRLELLHQRAVARSQGDDDDKAAKTQSHGTPKITPERAAQLAVQSGGGGHPTRMELRTAPNGKGYYEIEVETNSAPRGGPKSRLHVDSETGDVTTE